MQYEAGVRVTAGRLNINAAGFIIEKDNMAISDPLNAGFEVAQGRARSQGAELTVDGYATSNLYLSAGYGYTDTEVLRTDEEIFSPGSFDGVIREEGRTYLARVKYLF